MQKKIIICLRVSSMTMQVLCLLIIVKVHPAESTHTKDFIMEIFKTVTTTITVSLTEKESFFAKLPAYPFRHKVNTIIVRNGSFFLAGYDRRGTFRHWDRNHFRITNEVPEMPDYIAIRVEAALMELAR